MLSLLGAAMASCTDDAAPRADEAEGVHVAAATTEDDTVGKTTTTPPTGSQDVDGIATPADSNEGPRQGVATPPAGGPDGETPYQDPPNPNAPASPAAKPDLTAAQVLRLTQLSGASGRPFAARIDDTYLVPAFLRGAWTRSESSPSAAALAFLATLNTLYGVNTATDAFVVASTRQGVFTNVRLQQQYRGMPVFGAELIVHTKPAAAGATEVRFLQGTFVPQIDVGITPSITVAQARALARTHVEQTSGPVVGTMPATLTVYNTAVLDRRVAAPVTRLAWHVRAEATTLAARWSVMIDALTGAVLTSWKSDVDVHPSRVTDQAGTPSILDDVLWFENGVKLVAGVAPVDANHLETFGDNFYDWLLAHYAIDSLDDAGMQMIGATNNSLYAGNAAWNGTQANFGAGMATQDVIGHEYGHALVQFLGGSLIYSGESGALNEGFADLFGEYLDCQNGTGCNWQVGEDSQGNTCALGVIRDMSDPPLYSQPDHYRDFVVGGDVHTNSGILNKLSYLIAEGDTHRDVTVNGIGVNKAGYVAINTLINTGLTSSATYFELGDVLLETCEAVIGNAVVGEATPITAADCRDVQRACYAVGICPLTQADGWGAVEAFDRFGFSLATGDFDNDGFDDLAVGAPYEDRAGVADAGAVNVFFGSPYGIGSGRAEILDQVVAGTTNEAGDRFGYSLAAGDINGDGFDDLIVSAPYEDLGAVTDAGWIFTFMGSASGLRDNAGTASYERLSQASAGTSNEATDLFGFALAAGDINNDGFDDVAIGCPYESLGGINDSGRMTILYGAAGGLRVGGSSTFEHLWQDAAGAVNAADDHFGWSVTIGDINGDGFDDAVGGTPGKDFSGGITDGGWIYSFLASGSGLLSAAGTASYERLSQDSVATPRETGDQFGDSLLLTDIDGDGRADLVAGTPLEDLGALTDAGWIIPIYGTVNGLRSGGASTFQRISQSSLGTTRDAGDQFGLSLSSGDWNGDGRSEVVASAPYEALSGLAHAGWVFKINGGAGGLVVAAVSRWSASSLGGVRGAHDHVGYAVAAGDFDGDGDADLAVGAPDEDAGQVDSGAVYFHE